MQAPATHQGHAPLLVRLHQPTGAKVDVELPDHALTGLVGCGAGFLLMLRRGEQLGDPQPTDEDRRPWLAALDPTGGLRHGPPLALRGSWVQLVAADPPLVHDRGFGGNGRLRRVGDDLTLDDGAEMARTLLGVCGDAGRIWIAVHPPHPQDVAQRGAAACWPLKTPPTYPDDRQHWLLTELDPQTDTPTVSTLGPRGGPPRHRRRHRHRLGPRRRRPPPTRPRRGPRRTARPRRPHPAYPTELT